VKSPAEEGGLLEEIHNYSSSYKIIDHCCRRLPKMCKYNIVNDRLKGFTHVQKLSHQQVR